MPIEGSAGGDREPVDRPLLETPSVSSKKSDCEAGTASVLERLSPLVAAENLPRVAMIVEETIAQVTTHHSGPLPQASELSRYRDIDASFAERIVRMAEREQEFRHSVPSIIIEREYRLKSRGQHYALAIALAVLGFAALLAWLGDTDMAGKVAIGTLVGLVSLFVGGRVVDAISDHRKPETPGE